jgi:hypothetical protein
MSWKRGWLVAAVALVSAMLVLVVPDRAAADGPQGNGFGLGFALGNPSSITGKYYTGGSNFIDFHLGAFRLYDRGFYEDALFLAGDYVWEVYNFHEDETISIPFYIGVGGGLIADADDADCDVVRDGRCIDFDRNDYFEFAIGPRMPVGAAFQFQQAPFELFVEFSPSLYFIWYEDVYSEDLDIELSILNIALGGRFFFGG